MPLNVNHLATAVERAHRAMTTLEQELNDSDSKLGDGDTGSMLARVFDRLSAVELNESADLGAAFRALAAAAVAATGSSLGTLFGTALLTFARETKGTASLDWSRLSPSLTAARDAMIARGGAKLGDKTVLDALDAVASATLGKTDAAGVATAALAASQGALTRFRDKPCGIGRARMFAEKSVGLDDPGMLAFARLVEALAKS